MHSWDGMESLITYQKKLSSIGMGKQTLAVSNSFSDINKAPLLLALESITSCYKVASLSRPGIITTP